MATTSVGLEFAWEVAASEAISSRHEYVEPGHLFIGVCKVGNLANDTGSTKLNLSTTDIASLGAEGRAIESVFTELRLDRVALYREVRQRLGSGAYPKQDQRVMQPSAASRAVVEQSMRLGVGAPGTNSLHLLAALLESGIASIDSLLKEKGGSATQMAALALAGAAKSASGSQSLEPEPLVQIGETLSAEAGIFDLLRMGLGTNTLQLSLLYELPLKLANPTQLTGLLQTIVDGLLTVIPNAARGALLLVDGGSGRLVLKASAPAGNRAVSLTLANRAMSQREALIWQQNEEDQFRSAEQHGIGTGMYAPLIWHDSVLGVICVDHPDRETTFFQDNLRLLIAVAHYAAMAVAHQRALDSLRQHSELTNRLFSSRFPLRVRESLVRDAVEGRLPIGTLRSHVTVLTSDIRGFTQLAAQLGPQRTTDLLNEYFPPLIEAIHAHDGTIERFVGDAIFAVFGSPCEDLQQQEHAVRAALAMQTVSAALMRSRAARQARTCGVGIGIHCGEALHGFIGNADRLEYAVVGEPANLASRYCSAAGEGEILISDDVHGHVFNKFQAERVEIPTKHEGMLVAFRIKANGPAQ